MCRKPKEAELLSIWFPDITKQCLRYNNKQHHIKLHQEENEDRRQYQYKARINMNK